MEVNMVDVMAINYDFLPTSHQSRKSLWLQLRYPAPKNLVQGTIVKLRSTSDNLRLPSQTFKVLDVWGSRVILKTPDMQTQISSELTPFVPENQKWNNNLWYPLKHSPHWGYALKDWIHTIHTARNWTYGTGIAVAQMSWR
jgi:hypothetical protein